MSSDPHPREFESAVGALQLIELRVAYTYAGMLEGNARLSRKVYVMQLEDELATREQGLVVIGLDMLRAEVDARVDGWVPSERVRAHLRSSWTPPGRHPHGSTTLEVVWFQDPEVDPFERLRAI